jgi:hypothetical protein
VGDVEVEVPLESVQAGDTLVIQAGQIIPVDGVITGPGAWVATPRGNPRRVRGVWRWLIYRYRLPRLVHGGVGLVEPGGGYGAALGAV